MNDLLRIALRVPPPFASRNAPVWALATLRQIPATPGDPFRGDDPPPRPIPRIPSHLKEPPLTERERTAYVVLAVIGLTPLVLLAVVVVLAHSALFAN